jgi:starch phosphorylase
MPTVHAFHVVPDIPPALLGLQRLAYNLRWAWNHEAIELFRRLDRQLWEQCYHNPVQMLAIISQERLREVANDEAFLAQLERVVRSDHTYMHSATTWFLRNHAEEKEKSVRIAYFSMEFGLNEALPIYSGGLGILAGDHTKSSSDLDIPLVGMGLLYQQGYFRQALNAENWQEERYPENDFYHMPLQMVHTTTGEPLIVSVDFPGRAVYAQVWKIQVGRVPLYMLDTNIAPNSAADQNITDQLYGGNVEMRLQQEMILGIGGIRALHALGIEPTLCHMNEGHSAFLALERIRQLMEKQGIDFPTAREACAAGNLFTTHTPVPAGFDVFEADMLRHYFEAYVQKLGLSFEEFVGMGRVNPHDGGEKFNMAILALKNSRHCNGVSKLHGAVTRKMLRSLFPGYPEEEIPVSHVTNGIHVRSFISQEMSAVLDFYLGWRWSPDIADKQMWEKVNEIPDEEIWRVREFRRERLVTFVRNRLRKQYEQKGRSDLDIRRTQSVLDPNILTIGFARRFATYKRASLFMRDVERLLRLINDPERPVQIVIAGKAHPRDNGGKELIQQIVKFAQREEVRNRIVFIEDYDIAVARHLVQGVDLWLNNPRRPMEASGTSGMKVLANGGLNLSILDGWWAEGYDPRGGWAIGRGEEFSDPDYQDHVEAESFYEMLEHEIVPLFYDRGKAGIPRAWIARIKNSMRLLCPVFNTHRMVAEYAEKFYFPASHDYLALTENGSCRAKALVDWRRRIEQYWGQVGIERVETPTTQTEEAIRVGMTWRVVAHVRLGELKPEEVAVQAYHGQLDSTHTIRRGSIHTLTYQESTGSLHIYAGEVVCQQSGMQGVSLRILPAHTDATLPIALPHIQWG